MKSWDQMKSAIVEIVISLWGQKKTHYLLHAPCMQLSEWINKLPICELYMTPQQEVMDCLLMTVFMLGPYLVRTSWYINTVYWERMHNIANNASIQCYLCIVCIVIVIHNVHNNSFYTMHACMHVTYIWSKMLYQSLPVQKRKEAGMIYAELSPIKSFIEVCIASVCVCTCVFVCFSFSLFSEFSALAL